MDKIEQLINKISRINDDIERYKAQNGVDQIMKNMGHEFDRLCEELAKTHDMRGLLYLLDYFDEEFDLEYEGVLECIQSDIENNYEPKQICKALYEKFNQLLDKNLRRIVHICELFFCEYSDYEEFRKMFNEVKANKSAEFLDGLERRIDDDYEVGPEGIAILREDMKKW